MPPFNIPISSVGTPLFISFLGFTYIELQMDKYLPKSECSFYLDGMTTVLGPSHFVPTPLLTDEALRQLQRNVRATTDGKTGLVVVVVF